MADHDGWIRVSHEVACPVCGKPDWCMVARDGSAALCQRIENEHPRGEAGYLHRFSTGLGTVADSYEHPSHAQPREEATRGDVWASKVDGWYSGSQERRRELAGNLGVSEESLDALSVGWDGTAWCNPERDASGRIIGVSRRFPDGKKIMVPGSKRGLTYSPDWRSDNGPILVVEGCSDTAAGLALGICTIGRPSNTGGVEHLGSLFRGVAEDQRIIVLGENDAKENGTWPGRDGAKKTAETLQEILGRKVEWCLPPDKAKDLRSWLAKHDEKTDFISRLSPQQGQQTVNGNTAKLHTFQDAAIGYLDSIEQPGNELVSMGIPELDLTMGGGAAFGEMVVIGARPGHGKTCIGLQAATAAMNQGYPCLILSEEMTAIAVGKRVVQRATAIPEERWLSEREAVRSQVTDYIGGLKSPCYIADPCHTAKKASETIRMAVQQHGVRVVVVDYAQLLQDAGKGRYEQVSNTSVALKQTTLEHNIVLIALCQLNRAMEKRERMEPKVSDLRDSGQIEQDADVILFLLWPHRCDPQRDANEYLIYHAKNRNRGIKNPVVKCHFEPSRQIVSDARDAELDWISNSDEGFF